MAVSTQDTAGNSSEVWPELDLESWQDTYHTLHMWTQVVGKIRLEMTPLVNHWWNVPLYVTARGLTTSPIPDGAEIFQFDFDFISHQLYLATSRGDQRAIPLAPRTVADFYQEVMKTLRDVGVDVEIDTLPQEVVDPIPFEQDTVHASYDPGAAHGFWRVLVQADRLCKEFRRAYLGKASPVHFFWGSFDLALTFFSGRRAPLHPGGGLLPASVTREAYSHEVSSCGWWPGGGPIPYAAFYAYSYPSPEGYKEAALYPADAFYAADLGEFLLPYDSVRHSSDPDSNVLQFFRSTYEAAATLGSWDREALERH